MGRRLGGGTSEKRVIRIHSVDFLQFLVGNVRTRSGGNGIVVAMAGEAEFLPRPLDAVQFRLRPRVPRPGEPEVAIALLPHRLAVGLQGIEPLAVETGEAFLAGLLIVELPVSLLQLNALLLGLQDVVGGLEPRDRVLPQLRSQLDDALDLGLSDCVLGLEILVGLPAGLAQVGTHGDPVPHSLSQLGGEVDVDRHPMPPWLWSCSTPSPHRGSHSACPCIAFDFRRSRPARSPSPPHSGSCPGHC
jgi:hypothetical protein